MANKKLPVFRVELFTRIVFKLVFSVSGSLLWGIPVTSKGTQFMCNFQVLSVKAYWSVNKW